MMGGPSARVEKLLRQQAAIAGFGSYALRQPPLLEVLTEAARVCAEGLGVPFSKVCRYRPAEDDLLIEAGVGWRTAVVGEVCRADNSTPQGRAFITGRPSISNNLTQESAFVLPAFYAEHGIVSTIDVLIKGSSDQPYGVLEIDSDVQHDYDQHDVDFLTAFANVLAEAVSTSERLVLLQTTVARMQDLVAEKDRALDEKKVLAQELQHRVRNNLQLVYGMLNKQLDETTDEAAQRGIRAISRRVTTLSQVYDQLLGTEMTRTIDFGAYAEALCRNIAEVHARDDGAVRLLCACEEVMLDLDVVTALGIIVAELVTNSYDHAFPSGKGLIRVTVERGPDEGYACLAISDDGKGFEPAAESKRHGLGLVRRLAEQAHGTITVDVREGTRWEVRFPIPAPSEEAPLLL